MRCHVSVVIGAKKVIDQVKELETGWCYVLDGWDGPFKVRVDLRMLDPVPAPEKTAPR